MNLEGRCVLVTGGARRVGRAIGLELARAGCDVAIHYHTSETSADSLAEEIEELGRRCHLVRGDLARASSWSEVIAETVRGLGRLDCLINNASRFTPSSLDAFDADCFARTFQINVTAVAGLCHHAAPHLRDVSGCVVNLADVSADRPWSGHLAYCASKAAVVNLTRSLAKALAPGVRVNAVAPGIAVFPEDYDEAMRANLVAAVPMRRPGTVDEVARVVRFLCGEADYMTGQVVNVDGGRSISLGG